MLPNPPALRPLPIPRCLICGESGPLDRACSACHSPYHADCARYVGRCAVYGCGGRAFLAEREALISQETVLAIRRIVQHERWSARGWVLALIWLATFASVLPIAFLLAWLAGPAAFLAATVSTAAVATATWRLGPGWCFRRAEQIESPDLIIE